VGAGPSSAIKIKKIEDMQTTKDDDWKFKIDLRETPSGRILNACDFNQI